MSPFVAAFPPVFLDRFMINCLPGTAVFVPRLVQDRLDSPSSVVALTHRDSAISCNSIMAFHVGYPVLPLLCRRWKPGMPDSRWAQTPFLTPESGDCHELLCVVPQDRPGP